MVKVGLEFPSKDLIRGMRPIQTSTIFETGKTLHPDGLYSLEIFGEIGSELRSKTFSYIELNCKIMAPALFEDLISLNSLYGRIVDGVEYAMFDKEKKDLIKTTPEQGETGINFLFKHIQDIEFRRTDSDERSEKIDRLYKYIELDKVFIEQYLVIPAGVRDISYTEDERVVEFEVADLYKRLLGASSLLSGVTDSDLRSGVLDGIIRKVQINVYELYAFFIDILNGKSKFTRGSWIKRPTTYGTRNVITALASKVKILGGPDTMDMNTTTIGVYQFSKSIEPIALAALEQSLSAQFETTDRLLYNPKTFRYEPVDLPKKIDSTWSTKTGLESVLHSLAEPDSAMSPILYTNYWLKGVIDKGDTITVLNVGDIVEEEDRKYLRPITYLELIYLAIYPQGLKTHMLVTRYPVTGSGSVYPSKAHVRPTVKTRIAVVNDIEMSYPIMDSIPFSSLSVAIPKLAGLGGDFDGDKVSAVSVMTDTANDEIAKLLADPRYYISSNGSFSADLGDDITMDVINVLSR